MSYVKVSVRRVVKACEAYLKHRDERIERECEEMIVEEMKVKRFVFWGRTKTRYEAIKYLETNSRSYDWIECSCGAQARRVSELLQLAKLTGEFEMNLSALHAADLATYFE